MGGLQQDSWSHGSGSYFGETDYGWSLWAQPESGRFMVSARERKGACIYRRSLSFLEEGGKLTVSQRFEKGAVRVFRRVVIDLASARIEEVK